MGTYLYLLMIRAIQGVNYQTKKLETGAHTEEGGHIWKELHLNIKALLLGNNKLYVIDSYLFSVDYQPFLT